MKTRFRTCPHCREKFRPFNTFQTFCFKNDCILEHNRVTKAKKIRKDKQAHKALDKGHLTKIAQTAFNKYIRERDKDNGCITCGNKTRQMHAGHYRPVGRNARLRFNELNCHIQCSQCNNHLSGNLTPYREAMIRLYTLPVVEELENDNDPYKFDLDELKEITETYRKKFKEIEENS